MPPSNGKRSSGPVLRSQSPSGRFSSASNHHQNSSAIGSSPFASYSSSAFSPRPTSLFNRSASPTRVNLYSSNSPSTASPSIRFSYDQRSSSPVRTFSPRSQVQVVVPRQVPPTKKRCMCSPTNHPGSFRCSLHKNSFGSNNHHGSASAPYQSNRLNARRSAMTNSLVRIGTVEGDLVKRALAALIRPSSHQQRRRSAFQTRPSRLSVMSMAVAEEESKR